jgi:hypothetical protein
MTQDNVVAALLFAAIFVGVVLIMIGVMAPVLGP